MIQSPAASNHSSATNWSLVRRAAAEGPKRIGEALAQLAVLFEPRLKEHLTHRFKIDQAAAEDVYQSFVVERLPKVVARAKEGVGRFRSFLLKSIDHYTIELQRGGKPPFTRHRVALDDLQERDWDRPAPKGGSDPFEVAWARDMIAETLQRFRTRFEGVAGNKIWGCSNAAFCPYFWARRPVSYEEVARRLGFTSLDQARTACGAAKKKWAALFKAVIGETVDDASQIDEEIRYLRQLLSDADAPDDDEQAVVRVGTRSFGMEKPDLSKCNPKALAMFTDLEGADVASWAPEDLAAVLRQRMIEPAQFELAGVGAQVAAQTEVLASAHGLLLKSLDDLVRHAQPPVPLLVLTKEFAKANSVRGSTMPTDVADFLYYLVIAVGLLRRGVRITEMTDAELGRSWDWCLAQSWADQAYRDLIRQAKSILGAGIGSPEPDPPDRPKTLD